MFKFFTLVISLFLSVLLVGNISATPLQAFVNEDQFVDSRFPAITSPLNNPSGEFLWGGHQKGGARAYTFLNFILNEDWNDKDVELILPFNSFLGDSGQTVVWFNPNDDWVGEEINYNNLQDVWDYEAPIALIKKFVPSDQEFLKVSFNISDFLDFEEDNSLSLVIGSVLPDGLSEGDYWRDIANSDFSDGANAAEMVGRDLQVNPVPEPASILLFGTGFIGLAGLARRKRKKSPSK